jgi:hypothetical protein
MPTRWTALFVRGMRLTAEHRRALEAVQAGATHDQLGELLTRPEFVDLVNWDLVRCEAVDREIGKAVDFWMLTRAGHGALDSGSKD